MTEPTRTNPAYAFLAYQKTIVSHAIAQLQRDLMGTETSEPKIILVCDDVVRADSEVPVDAVAHFVQELETKEAEYELELKQFDFRRVDEKGPTKQSRPKAGSKSKKAGRKAGQARQGR